MFSAGDKMTMLDLKNTALEYAGNRGWACFPVHGLVDGKCTCGNSACPNPGKHPATGNGLKSATTDPRGINLMFKPGYNLAVATGEVSGFWVLDIDGQAGESSLAGLESEHGPLPHTVTHYTGKGRHLFFRWPGVPVKNSVRQLGDGLDVRGDGGYIVAAPSMHASGVQYRFADLNAPIADAPDWLLSRVRRDAPSAAVYVGNAQPVEYADRDLTAAQVQDMLSHIHPDCDYQTWVEIGMGLHAGGWPVQMWDEWSRGGAKYQNGDCYKRWRGFKPGHGVTFGTVWHHAQANGWSPDSLDAGRADGPHPAAGFLAKLRAGPKLPATAPAVASVPVPTAPGCLPFRPMDLTGPIGDTVRWIVASSIRPQPELALLNVLAAMGAVFGRRYASPWDTRTNVYIVGIAGTGSGKDHSRKQIKKLLAAANLQDYMAGDSIVSGAGLLRGLSAQPAQILHLDEFGMLLRAITDERGATHMKAAAKAMTELFSASGSVFHGGHYAGTEAKPVIIDHPHMCIYGTSALSTYREALSRAAIASGELNRFLVLPAADDLPKLSRTVQDVAPPDRLVSAWATFGAPVAPGQGNLVGVGGRSAAPPKPILVRWDNVLDRVHDIGDRADEVVRDNRSRGLSGVWTRYREQVLKLAMISAIARNPLLPVLEDGDLDFAEAVVWASCEYVMHLAKDHIADNQTERDANAVLEFLRSAGSGSDGWVSKTDLSRAFRGLSGKARGALLDDLINVQDAVELRVDKSTEGKPKTYYRLRP